MVESIDEIHEGTYRIISKVHFQKSKPAFIDAESNSNVGRIYRSDFENENTLWKVEHVS